MISFIIPTYNEEKVIGATLKRLRNGLSAIPYEIIVTDDGSTDRTLEEARPYADQVLVCPAGMRSTIGANRNRGAHVAQYEYLVFLDSGVVIPEPNHFFANALRRFSQQASLVALTANLRVLPSLATLADTIVFGIMNLWFRLANNILGIGIAQGKFQMVRASAFYEVAGYNASLVAGEDADLFYRLSRIGQTRLESSLTIYHQGRRGHVMGWPRLLWIWLMDAVYIILLKRSYSKEWKPIR